MFTFGAGAAASPAPPANPSIAPQSGPPGGGFNFAQPPAFNIGYVDLSQLAYMLVFSQRLQATVKTQCGISSGIGRQVCARLTAVSDGGVCCDAYDVIRSSRSAKSFTASPTGQQVIAGRKIKTAVRRRK